MLHNYFNEVKGEGKYICIYSNKDDTSAFSLGSIEAVDENYLLLNSIGNQGKYDGRLLKKTDDIFMAETDNRYIESIIKLQCGAVPEFDAIPIRNGDICLSFLEFAKKNKLLVSIQLFNSGKIEAMGYVSAVDEESVKIDSFNFQGEKDGEAEVLLGCITCVSCDSSDERLVMKLIQANE